MFFCIIQSLKIFRSRGGELRVEDGIARYVEGVRFGRESGRGEVREEAQ